MQKERKDTNEDQHCAAYPFFIVFNELSTQQVNALVSKVDKQ